MSQLVSHRCVDLASWGWREVEDCLDLPDLVTNIPAVCLSAFYMKLGKQHGIDYISSQR